MSRGLEDREDREDTAEAYLDGNDILGSTDMSSVMPWLSMFGAGGKDKGPSADDARRAEDQAKRDAAASRTRGILYTVLGVVGAAAVGTGIYLVAARR